MQDIAKILLIVVIIICIILTLIKCIKVIKYRIFVSKLNHNRYKMAIEALNGAVWEWHKDLNILYLSSRMRKIVETDEIIDTYEKAERFIAEEDREFVSKFFEDKLSKQDESEFTLEFTVVSRSGKRIDFECSGKGRMKKDKSYYLAGVLVDITEKKMKEKLLRSSEKNYRLALDGSQDIMFYCNLDKDKLIFNNRIEELISLGERDTHIISIQQWVNCFVLNEDKQSFMDEYKKVKNGEGEYFSLEYRMQIKNKNVAWVRTRGKVVVEGSERNIYGSITNINDRKEKELKIYYMSYYDQVTGIANRRYFEEEMSKFLSDYKDSKRKVALIFIDIDNFKFVNDTYGHQVGDQILVMFSNKLKMILNHNCLSARFGGDEFIISIKDIYAENEVKKTLDNILDAFNKPFQIEGKEIYCTVSIGVSFIENQNKDLKTALKHSDIAMYKAKTSGKNQYYFFNTEMENKLKRELDIKTELMRMTKTKEIHFNYQPKYWCDSGSIQGIECLARWNSSKMGTVRPDEFIPLSESTGMIIEIEKYLIEDALLKFSKVKDKLVEDFKISINLSQVQIQDSELLPFIKEKLEKYDIEPKLIEFEVTESIIMKYPENAIKVLKELKEIGVSIALDDFGTGYSSLNYLKMIPLDIVKIDKSFIDDIGKNSINEKIIEKIVELAHSLNLKVVAEGVEEESQVKYLKLISCDILQGYYFSKPIEFNELLKMIE